jgi:hypothetical protein
MHAELRAPHPAYTPVPPWLAEFGGAVHQSLIATQMTWFDLASRCLRENLSLPEQLRRCESVPGSACVFGTYCRTIFDQYEAAFAQFQEIALKLASEVPVVGLLPARNTSSLPFQDGQRAAGDFSP